MLAKILDIFERNGKLTYFEPLNKEAISKTALEIAFLFLNQFYYTLYFE